MMAPRSGETSGQTKWIPRGELALPNELLHKIILLVISDCVHSVCVSSDDTLWEKRVIDTLHQVSPVFKAIANELASLAFEIPNGIRDDSQRLLPTLRAKFIYLSHLGSRFRHPSDWHSTFVQTLDSSTHSSFVFSYALYLSSVCLRRNASRSPRGPFESTHKVILAALSQCERLCDRVMPLEITAHLRQSIEEELELARNGLTIVRSFHELNNHAHSMRILQPSQDQDGTGPLAGVCSLIHTSLLKMEGAYDTYTVACSRKPPRTEPQIYELPGVISALRGLAALDFNEDEYNLSQRVRCIVAELSKECPFLKKTAVL